MRKVLLLAVTYILFGSVSAQEQYSVMGSDGVIRNPEKIQVNLLRETIPWRDIANSQPAEEVRIYHDYEADWGPRYEKEKHEEEEEGMLQGRRLNMKVNPNALPKGEDPLRQKVYNTNRSQNKSTQIGNWEGMQTTTAPGDPVMDVGPNHVVQMLNSGSNGTDVKIWDKTGTVLMSQTAFHTLAGTTQGFGDPVVVYDQRADRCTVGSSA